MPINAYGALICLVCALFMGIFLLRRGPLIDTAIKTSWWVLAAMALGPQLIGHIGLITVFVPLRC